MNGINLAEKKTLHIDQVFPYWRNPRILTTEAVEAVRRSLDTYGYLQPIVVDTDDTIIIGHTRYSAMRKLGYTEIEVVVADLPPKKAKELRIVDNRSQEYSLWDFEKLVNELTGAEDELMTYLFPEAQFDASQDDGGDGFVDASELEDEEPHEDWQYVDDEVQFVCPHCFHEWEQEVTREMVMSGKIKQKGGKK